MNADQLDMNTNQLDIDFNQHPIWVEAAIQIAAQQGFAFRELAEYACDETNRAARFSEVLYDWYWARHSDNEDGECIERCHVVGYACVYVACSIHALEDNVIVERWANVDAIMEKLARDAHEWKNDRYSTFNELIVELTLSSVCREEQGYLMGMSSPRSDRVRVREYAKWDRCFIL